jgi:hypothetical protein
MELNRIRDKMIYSGYIDKDKIIDLVKKYPNDTDLGHGLRKLYFDELLDRHDDEINCC